MERKPLSVSNNFAADLSTFICFLQVYRLCVSQSWVCLAFCTANVIGFIRGKINKISSYVLSDYYSMSHVLSLYQKVAKRVFSQVRVQVSKAFAKESQSYGFDTSFHPPLV